MTRTVVDVLTFEGCPHAQPARELVERVVAELGLDATVRRVDVPDLETAAMHRFLGSPSIRVNGRDVEPGAEERSEFVLSCRIYRADGSFKGEPDEHWLHDALIAASGFPNPAGAEAYTFPSWIRVVAVSVRVG